MRTLRSISSQPFKIRVEPIGRMLRCAITDSIPVGAYLALILSDSLQFRAATVCSYVLPEGVLEIQYRYATFL